jgi:hypothetical protein
MFWVVTPCRLVGRFQRFGETYCIHLSSSKCWYLPTSPHGVTKQSYIFTLSDVRKYQTFVFLSPAITTEIWLALYANILW